MTRDHFIRELKIRLVDLSKEEKESAIRYYEEMFDEAEDVEALIASFDSVETIANEIKKEFFVNNETKARAENGGSFAGKLEKMKGDLPWWAIILMGIFALPMIIPVLGVLFGLVVAGIAMLFAGMVVLVSLIFAFFVVTIAVIGVAISMFIYGVSLFPVSIYDSLMFIGVGIIIFGIGLLFIIPLYGLLISQCRWSKKQIIKVFQKVGSMVEKMFGGRENV